MSHALSRHSDSGEKHTRNTDCLQQRGSGTTTSNRHTAGVGGNSAGSRSAINLKEYFTKEPSSASTSDPLQSSSTCSKKRRTSDSSHPNHSSKESGSHPAKRKKRNSHSAESPLAEEKTMSSLPSQSTSAFKNGVHPVIRSNSTESGPTSVTKSRQAKKLVIKNFKAKPEVPSDYGEQMWRKLQEAIVAIYDERPISYTLQELYQAVENMCSYKMAPTLYGRLQRICQEHVATLLPMCQKQCAEEIQFLHVVQLLWQTYCQQMLLIQSIFLYLDRTYVMQTTGILPIWDLGLDLFGSSVVVKDGVCLQIVQGVLDCVRRERAGETVDRGLLRSIIHMFQDLQMYQRVFECKFLQETEVLYHAKGQEMVNSEEFTLPVCLQHIHDCLLQEEDRVLHYLDECTRKPLILCLERELIAQHTETMINKGFDTLVELTRKPDLHLMYQLFGRVKHGRQAMCTAFAAFIKKSGCAIVSDEERDKTMVEDLLTLKTKADDLVREVFEGDAMFVAGVKDSFETAVNKRQNKPAELLAKFVDSQLRSGNKEWTDEEMERLLDRVLVLFRFIHGKDVFEAFYKKDLAKRLLVGKSASADAEKSMLLKLKQECGSQFTSKLEGMFKDIEVSQDLMMSFRQHAASRRLPGGLDMSVVVLTMGYWPTYTPMTVHIPQQLNQYLDAFQDFYLRKHSGRKLTWQPNLGHCQLKAVFPQGEKELQVSFFQALVLLLFDDVDKLSFADISQATNIEFGELQRTLQSLSMGKARVLLKHPKGKEVERTDRFMLNREFKHKLFKIKINQVQLKETVEENQATNKRVFQDRQYQVDAAIVRIMKMRKSLSHSLLIAECFEQLRFPIKPSDLKKRIESLIERDYMKRDDDNPQMYQYIA